MSKNRPGRISYHTATKQVEHGDPVVENNVVGVAVKQQAVAQGTAISTHQTIIVGEKFAIIKKGVVEVPTVSGGTKGAAVYITAASNALSTTASGNVAFGRVHEVAGERGTPTGFIRVDLDAKDSI